MTVGLRVRDPATGVVQVEVTDRVTKVLGTLETGTAAGSITVPEFANGTPWVIALDYLAGNAVVDNLAMTPTINGLTLSWAVTGQMFPSRPPRSMVLVYGIY